MDENLSNIIVLNDENGNAVRFEFLDLIEYDAEEYVILLPEDGGRRSGHPSGGQHRPGQRGGDLPGRGGRRDTAGCVRHLQGEVQGRV